MNEINVGDLKNWKIFFQNTSTHTLFPHYKLIAIRMYDCLGHHISNGGLTHARLTNGQIQELDQAQEILIGRLHMAGIHYDQIMTNFYLDEIDDRLDRRLRFLSNFTNQGVTVSTLKMLNLVKERYPKLLTRWSITAFYRDWPKDIKSYIDRIPADRFVLPVEYNANFDKLKSLSADKIELMAYDQCGICGIRKMHYTLSSKDQVRMVEDESFEISLNAHFCQKVNRKTSTPTLLLAKDLLKLSKLGINKFKIASRNFDGQDCAFYLRMALDALIGEPYQIELSERDIFDKKQLLKDVLALKKETP